MPREDLRRPAMRDPISPHLDGHLCEAPLADGEAEDAELECSTSEGVKAVCALRGGGRLGGQGSLKDSQGRIWTKEASAQVSRRVAELLEKNPGFCGDVPTPDQVGEQLRVVIAALRFELPTDAD